MITDNRTSTRCTSPGSAVTPLAAMIAAALAVGLIAAGCGGSNGDAPTPDATTTDAGNAPDAAPGLDAHAADAGPTDAGPTDAATTDAAPPVCDPSAPGTGLPTLTAPTFTAAVSASTPVFRTLTDNGRLHYPDGAVTFRDTGAGWQVYLPAGRESYRLTGPSPTTMTLDPVTPIIEPTNDPLDPHQGYAGITSVLECGGALAAFFHAEYHSIPVTPWTQCPAPYHASMARATSVDQGVTFATGTPSWFLNAAATATYGQPKCAYGAGGGSIFDPGGDYLYLFYYDWDAPNGIYLARTCSDDCGASGTWRKYNAGAFTSPAFASDFLQPAGPSTPLVSAVMNNFDAFPVVSHNTYLNAYLMVAATESGFALRVSADAITWGPRLELLQHVTALDDTLPVYYPTIVDAQTWSRDLTGRHLKLIHAIVANDQGQRAPHRAFIVDVELTLPGDTQTVTYDRLVLARHFNPASPYDHWVTTNTATGYPWEANLGLLAANSLPGTHPLYDCVIGGQDHMVSQQSDCEGGTSLGIMGYAWSAPATGRQPIHRCSMTTPQATIDHFVSLDPACEGLTVEGLVGYVE